MKKFKRRYKSKKGLTLVELIVAIAVVSIVFSAAMTAIVHGYASIAQNNSIDEASIKAQGVADTVASTLGNVLSDTTITDYDAAVLGAINDTSGLKEKLDNVEFFDGVSHSLSNFPSDSSSKEIQCAVQKIDTLSTTRTGSLDVNCVGYKIMVCVGSSQGDIIVSSMVTSD